MQPERQSQQILFPLKGNLKTLKSDQLLQLCAIIYYLQTAPYLSLKLNNWTFCCATVIGSCFIITYEIASCLVVVIEVGNYITKLATERIRYWRWKPKGIGDGNLSISAYDAVP